MATTTVPVVMDGRVVAAVAVTLYAGSVEHRIHLMIVGLATFGLLILAAAAVVGLLLARSVSRPLADLKTAAALLGVGQLSARAPATGPGEVRDLAGTFNEMASRLEALVRAQQRFVADASHQLRSPLTALRLRLDNLQLSNPQASTDLEAATTEVLRLSRLVDGLLPSPEPRAFAANSRSSTSAPSSRSGGGPGRRWPRNGRSTWRSSPRCQPATVLTSGRSPATWSRSSTNLLANALDATPAGGAVILSIEIAGRDVTIHVRDNGPGMSDDERAHAFGRFWRGSSGAAHTGGAGLGLAIVEQLVRARGGQIHLLAAEGGGLDAAVTIESG